MKVSIHTHTQSQPHTILDATQTSTKNGMFCVVTREAVQKFPLENVFRVEESNA